MNRKVRVILAVLALVAAFLCAFGAWKLYELAQFEKMEQAVWDAWYASYSDDAPAYLDAIDRETYFVLEEIEKGEPYVLTVTVYGVDLGGKLRETDPAEFPNTDDEQVLNDYLLKLLEESEYTKVQTFLYAWPEDGGYHIQFSDTFVDAMTGMIMTYAREMVEEVVGGAQ